MALETAFYLGGAIFLVATLYSSVGHGGASGYLAVLAFCALSPNVMASTALGLNVLVAGVACYQYARAGYLQWERTWPFLLASVPAAFAGGYFLKIDPGLYGVLLALVLAWAACRLLLPAGVAHDAAPCARFHPWRLGVPLAGGIGLLSGVIGVGGGIFLSPIMLAGRWATVKQTSATAACFIVFNSLAGLLGRYLSHSLAFNAIGPVVVAALAGSLLGSRLGAYRSSSQRLRQLLGTVLLVAAWQALMKAVF
jgi:uncharacterized membrane protein YfcA